MRYLLILFLLISSATHAQLTKEQMQELHDNTRKIDSQTNALNESINASIQRMDSVNRELSNKQMARNMDAFLAERKEQERKAKQGAYIRIGFGVLMLIVLIVGLRRKKKQATV